MTEQEWLALKDVPMLYGEGYRLVAFTRRKGTLFGVACVRATPGDINQCRLLDSARQAEKAADTGEWGTVSRLHHAASVACGKVKQETAAHYWALATERLTDDYVARYWPEVTEWLYRASAASGQKTQELRGAYVFIMRDIVGNPFRPVTFSPAWRSDTAVLLAKHMYESRDFSVMPILADALQDAGCDDDDMLNHCRDEKQIHVRGCWVVDLVLGKV
jgi:hypothetical protein